MKKILFLLFLALATLCMYGVQAARADGCCCDGTWNPSGTSCE